MCSRCSSGSWLNAVGTSPTTLFLSDMSKTAPSSTPAGLGGKAACILASESIIPSPYVGTSFLLHSSHPALFRLSPRRKNGAYITEPDRILSTTLQFRLVAQNTHSTSTKSSVVLLTLRCYNGEITLMANKPPLKDGYPLKVGERRMASHCLSPRASTTSEWLI